MSEKAKSDPLPAPPAQPVMLPTTDSGVQLSSVKLAYVTKWGVEQFGVGMTLRGLQCCGVVQRITALKNGLLRVTVKDTSGKAATDKDMLFSPPYYGDIVVPS